MRDTRIWYLSSFDRPLHICDGSPPLHRTRLNRIGHLIAQHNQISVVMQAVALAIAIDQQRIRRTVWLRRNRWNRSYFRHCQVDPPTSGMRMSRFCGPCSLNSTLPTSMSTIQWTSIRVWYRSYYQLKHTSHSSMIWMMGAVIIPTPIAGIPDPASSRRRMTRTTVSLALVTSSRLRLRVASMECFYRLETRLVTMRLREWQRRQWWCEGSPRFKECRTRASGIFCR